MSWGFSALQRAENSSIWNIRTILNFIVKFQCSSASRKFLNDDCRTYSIPHTRRFSALQRAENSSIIATPFQIVSQRQSFSALQRAENSSMHPGNDADWIVEVFQCSSASRKFLNLSVWVAISPARDRFSALQRAENSSIRPAQRRVNKIIQSFSALQRAENSSIPILQRVSHLPQHVSVLFSEPKIPQSSVVPVAIVGNPSFSALQRAENSSIGRHGGCSGR